VDLQGARVHHIALVIVEDDSDGIQGLITSVCIAREERVNDLKNRVALAIEAIK
jgi:hypothetical protein|tara:strand:- start:8 stop:169 length:162 start_codon:yes stop_codon:yes gene_type:complete